MLDGESFARLVPVSRAAGHNLFLPLPRGPLQGESYKGKPAQLVSGEEPQRASTHRTQVLLSAIRGFHRRDRLRLHKPQKAPSQTSSREFTGASGADCRNKHRKHAGTLRRLGIHGGLCPAKSFVPRNRGVPSAARQGFRQILQKFP